MNTTKKIAKNTTIIGISQLIVSVLNFIILVYIARTLGEEEFGKYNFALSFTSLFLILADIGISNLMIRSIARNKDKIEIYLTNIALIKLILAFIASIIIIISINLMNYPQETTYAVYLFGFYTILTTFVLACNSIYQAFEKMEYSAIISIIEKVLIIFFIIIFLDYGQGIIGLGYAHVLTEIFSVSLAIYIVLLKIAKPKLEIDFKLWRLFIIGSIPFGLNAFFGLIYFKIDTIMLSIIEGDTSVGIYNAAYVPLLTLSSIVSYSMTYSIYPMMSKYFISDRKYLNLLKNLSLKYVSIVGFPIGTGCFLLADKFITLFYADQYTKSVMAFQIIALFIPIRLINSVTGTFLTSINKQNLRTFGVGLGALINIALNAVMIPYFSYIGASIATILSEIILYFIFIYYVNKYHEKIVINKYFMKPILSSIIMGIFTLYFIQTNLITLIVLAAIVYFIVLISLRTFTEEELNIFKQTIKRG